MEMKLLQVLALVAIFHGIQGGPMRKEEGAAVTTAVKDISTGKGDIIRWFNKMGDSLKQQAKGAIQDFQNKLEETTEGIAKKFQEQKEQILKSKHAATLNKLSEQITANSNKLQGNIRTAMNKLNLKMKTELEKTKEQVKGLENQLTQNFQKTMKSIKFSFPNLFD